MTITNQMLHLSQSEFWVFLTLSGGIAIAGFWFTFRSLIRARTIEDTPTAKIRSAQQGYVELAGQAKVIDGDPTLAPLTGMDCCWYRYKIEKHGGKNWHTLESAGSEDLFLLDDETGECIIDPEGAEVTPSDKSVWYGSSRYPENRNPQRQTITQQPLFKIARVLNTKITFGNRYRYTEERIYPGDALYAIGLFRSLDDVDHMQNQQRLTRELLQEWKQNKRLLLERFDQDRNGKIDLQEWELARRTAHSETQKTYKAQIDNQTLHSLTRTSSRSHPFLLSTLPQFNLVRRYRLWAGGSITAFFIGGSVALWMLNTYL